MSIRQRRLDKGWSQEELARHSGLSTRTTQRIETGQPPRLESLKCLAAVLETSISTLVQEQKMSNPNVEEQNQDLMINQIELEAIEFAQSILDRPQKERADPLTKIERQAIEYAKTLLKKFSARSS